MNQTDLASETVTNRYPLAQQQYLGMRCPLCIAIPQAGGNLFPRFHPEGISYSFTMSTVNANEHPLMRRFHRPGDKKRSVVIVRPDDFEAWLGRCDTDEAQSFLNLFPAEEMATMYRRVEEHVSIAALP